jgi:hypothetical protein
MKTVKLLALLLSALSVSGAQPEPPTKQLVLQWTTVDNRPALSSLPLYRINSLWCGQGYCRLEIISVFTCDVRTLWRSAIHSEQMRTDDLGNQFGNQLQVTRTGETVFVQVGQGQFWGSREWLTYRVTGDGRTPTGEVQSGQVTHYEGHFVDGLVTQALEPLKCDSVRFLLLAGGCGNVSIPCPVIAPAMNPR